MKIGDRFRHISGSIWTIKELHPTSAMMSVGWSDLVCVPFDDLFGSEGDMPLARRKFMPI